MANSIFEQFDELYSRWSILDKVGKEMQLGQMWHQMYAARCMRRITISC